jgi:hypothetical protein
VFAEQVIRPTGLIDPPVTSHPLRSAIPPPIGLRFPQAPRRPDLRGAFFTRRGSRACPALPGRGVCGLVPGPWAHP